MKKYLLFFYSTPYSGHRNAAEAVRIALRKHHPQVETHDIDLFTYGYPLVAPLIAKTYLEIIKHFPQIWDYIWDNETIEQITRPLRQLFSQLSTTKLENLVNHFQASALVCTHAFPCSLIAEEKKRKTFSLPLVGIVTDFAVHPYWLHKEVNLYIVPTEKVKKEMVDRGIKEKKIRVYGIPINPQFIKSKNKKQVRRQLKMHTEIPTVLIMGGSNGLGMEKTVSLCYDNLDTQIVVVTGLNKKLYYQLKRYFYKSPRVHIFGYTRNISEIMDSADLLITKPGGLTSAEALVKRLPMIIFNPLPGQEEHNTTYLVEQGVAKRVNTPEELIKMTKHLLQNRHLLNRMSHLAYRLSSPLAAEKTVHAINEII